MVPETCLLFLWKRNTAKHVQLNIQPRPKAPWKPAVTRLKVAEGTVGTKQVGLGRPTLCLYKGGEGRIEGAVCEDLPRIS